MNKKLDDFTTKKSEIPCSYSDSSHVALSQKASRFWIPFDVKMLETLTPKEYLEKYCRINHRRMIVYKRIFDKYKDGEAQLSMEVLPDALSDAYMGTFDNQLIRQFNGMAAFSERYLFKIFRRFDNTDSQLQKDILEILDFSSLEWKLDGINISSKLREILKNI